MTDPKRVHDLVARTIAMAAMHLDGSLEEEETALARCNQDHCRRISTKFESASTLIARDAVAILERMAYEYMATNVLGIPLPGKVQSLGLEGTDDE
jgi:hypothetical protein